MPDQNSFIPFGVSQSNKQTSENTAYIITFDGGGKHCSSIALKVVNNNRQGDVN